MRAAAVCLISVLSSLAAHSATWADGEWTDVPPALQGVWEKEGRCDVEADRLTISSDTAGWGRGPFNPVHYAPDDRTVYWVAEYNTDNFQSGGTPHRLLYNSQGFNMPGRQGYGRCGVDLSRLPWSPKRVE